MEKSIYVFSKENRDRLIELGLILLKEDDKNEIYTFKTPDVYDVSFDEIEDYMLSNTLTF